MPVFTFSVSSSWGIAKCSLSLEWPFWFGVKNLLWMCKWKISLNKMSSENYIHTTTTPTMVTVRAVWIPPVLCEYLHNKDSLLQYILWGHWSSPLPYRKETKTKPNNKQTNIQKNPQPYQTKKKPPTKQKTTKHIKTSGPPHSHWHKSLNSASGTIIVIILTEILKNI